MSPAAAPGRGLLVGVLAALALVAGGCAEVQDTAPSSQPASKAPEQATVKGASQPKSSTARPHKGSAAAQLASLRVAGRAPMTGYDRDRFGYAWLDADRNGCDTRNDILRRDLRPLTLKAGTQGCVVSSGMLADPYTRARIDFVRGDTYSVDIDHVVALGNAWASGAWRMDVHDAGGAGQRPAEPARRGRERQPAEGRLRRGIVAASEQGPTGATTWRGR